MLLLVSVALPVLLLGWGISEISDDDEDAVGETLEGDDGNDMLDGSQGNDLIRGNGGDDVLQGRAGDDTVLGHAGDDILQGQDGADTLCSGDGDDILTGNRGADFLEGQEGDDFVSGDYSRDLVRGDEGQDTVIGGRGTDVVNGGDGDDVVFGGIVNRLPLDIEEMEALRDGTSLAEILEGENGTINIRDDRFGDTLYGAAGNDQIFIGGLDVATGNNGDDTFNLLADQVGDGPATITDFNPDDDNVTVIVNRDLNTEIEVRTDGEDALVVAGGEVLARVTGAAGSLTAADVTVLTEASVVHLFDPNA